MNVRNDPPSFAHPGFRAVPRTGVIYVMTEAIKRGFTAGDPAWANLGQGAPETGPIPGAPARVTTIAVSDDDYEYSQVDGKRALREAVANLYNERYRSGKQSKYTADNVAISSGGRVALTRAVSTLGRSNVGHLLPDYTAYEELLDAFGSFVPIPILLSSQSSYQLSQAELEREILGRGLSAILLSNPGNPAGQVIQGESLHQWVATSRTHGCTLIVDEFYSHYLYDSPQLTLSAAEFVEDVERDPVVIIDGLTKNWRYPGFRISWTLGPREVIERIASAGSFLDGGPAQPMQRAALTLLSREFADKEAAAIQHHFKHKRHLLTEGLQSLGVTLPLLPQGAFYCWGDLSQLPPPLNDGMRLFERALDAQVIVVPGEFFDINPGHRRPERRSRFQHYARFSFGPSEEVLRGGLERLGEVIHSNR